MKLSYRPEIDGLRAIAVLSVIFFHAIPNRYIGGGFLGVDIFFVISGYLIGRIIISDVQNGKSFSFFKFYERRIRRIFPALILVLLVTAPAAWLFLLPYQLVDYSESALATILSISNFYFDLSQQEYGATNSMLVPLLHTWSLSVEEQFYLVFPVLCVFIYRFARNPLHWFIFLSVVSILTAQFMVSKGSSSFGFYMLPTRSWELLIGACLASLELKGGGLKNKLAVKYAPLFGLVLIATSFIAFDINTLHPSVLTLIPTVGVALIIYYANNSSLGIKLLSSKPTVSIGLISYSLYLFHYPILAFSRVTNFTSGSVTRKLILVIGLLTASALSYRFIERPARSRSVRFRAVIIIILMVSVFVGALNALVVMRSGFPDRMPPILRESLDDVPLWEILSDENGKCFDRSPSRLPCVFNDKGNKTAFLLGDSHMTVVAASGLVERLVNLNYKVLYYSGVTLLPNTHRIILRDGSVDPINNNDYYTKVLNEIQSSEEPLVVFFARIPLYLSGKYVSNGESGFNNFNWGAKIVDDSSLGIFNSFQEVWSRVIDSNGAKLMLLYPYPEPGVNVPVEFASKIPVFKSTMNKNLNPDLLMSMDYTDYQERAKIAFELFDNVVHENVYRIYPHDIVCQKSNNKCYLNDEKNLYYTDSDHPSRFIGEKISEQVIRVVESSD